MSREEWGRGLKEQQKIFNCRSCVIANPVAPIPLQIEPIGIPNLNAQRDPSHSLADDDLNDLVNFLHAVAVDSEEDTSFGLPGFQSTFQEPNFESFNLHSPRISPENGSPSREHSISNEISLPPPPPPFSPCNGSLLEKSLPPPPTFPSAENSIYFGLRRSPSPLPPRSRSPSPARIQPTRRRTPPPRPPPPRMPARHISLVPRPPSPQPPASPAAGNRSQRQIASPYRGVAELQAVNEAVEDVIETTVFTEPTILEYEFIPKGTTRGKGLICDSFGFRYSKKSQETGYVWRCTSRDTKKPDDDCGATLTIRSHIKDLKEGKICNSIVTFKPHNQAQPHKHEGQIGTGLRAKIIRDVKEMAKADLHRPMGDNIDDVYNQHRDEMLQAGPSNPVKSNVRRAGNRAREDDRTKPPAKDDFTFTVNESAFPEKFYRGTVKGTADGKTRHHLIFATDHQLRLLMNAKRWFVDGTFCLIELPCKQLWCIHAMLKGVNGCQKMVNTTTYTI